MRSFEIENSYNNTYSIIVYATSVYNPFEDLDEIEQCLKSADRNAGTILFDLLLSNGDCFNRFAEAYFDGEKIIEASIQIIQAEAIDNLNYINVFYKKNRHLLSDGVLTPREILKFTL